MESTRIQRDLWSGVHRRLTRPAGWLLIIAGVLVWAVLAVVRWFRSELTVEWLSATAVLIGLALLLLSLGYEQYRQWKNDRYKDVHQ
jgi:membrane protein YdbS with pleckstrin-like domain